jgi:uncharacterized protein involved in outer membrane biogenesis
MDGPVQHGLLALAIALILAIVAALFAPAYVDWNDWRAGFERQASELAGTPVQIRGPIEATILPTPAFVLRDVQIGDPEQSTGIHAGEVQGTLSLGALLRGAFEAEDFALISPSIRIALEQGGRIVLPVGGAKASDGLSISRFAVSGGSLTIEDRAEGSLTYLDGVSAIGEMHSRMGPLRLDAVMRRDGRRWNLRASTGVFGAEGARTRLTLERPDDGALLEADGMLAFAAGLPRFNGRVNLAHAKSAGLPWKIAAQASASGDLVSFESLELTAGGNEFPLELSGHLQFVPRRGGKIEGMLSAKRLDLDRALGVQPGGGLAALIAPLRETLNRGAELPLKGRIGLAVDLLLANGAQVRKVKGEIGFREGFLGIDSMEARLPGRAYLRASSAGSGAGYFQGDLLLEAAEPAALVRWAFGPEQGEAFGDYASLRISGQADWSPERISADRLELSLDETKLAGSFALLQRDGTPASLKAALTANGINLDLLAPLASALWTGSHGSKVTFGFQGQALKLYGKELKRIDASVLRNADGVSIERLRVEDFDGLTAQAGGKLAGKGLQAGGRITFDLSAVRSGGLAAIARQFGGGDAGALVQKIFSGGMPVKLAGSASGGEKDVILEAKGRLADVAASFNARLDSEDRSVSEAGVSLEAAESGKLLALFGISPGLPAPGDGRLELSLQRPKAGVYPLQARLLVPGADLSASGEVLRAQDGRIEPRLKVRLDADDLRPALAAVSRVSDAAVAAKGSASLSRSADALAFNDIALEVAGTRVQGQLLLNGIEKPAISGRLAMERLELADLLALLAGRSGDAKNFWPAARLRTAALAGASGSVELEAAALGLAGAHVATNAKFHLKLGEPVEIANFSADYAGGKLAGDARISGAKTITFDGRGSLNGFDIARALTPGTGKAAARGRGNLLLSLAGSGATPAALAANLSGQGTLSLENFEIDTLDPAAIATVVSAAEKHMPRDESHLIQGVNKMLARAPLTLASLEAPLVAANGTLRTGKAITKTGDVDVTVEASANLAQLQLDGAIEMETAGTTSARPGVTVRWRGPFASPARTVDVSALSTAINLRAMEREMKRLEQRDRTALPVPRAQ